MKCELTFLNTIQQKTSVCNCFFWKLRAAGRTQGGEKRMRSGAAGWKGREWKDVANPAGCGIIRQSTAREGWQWKRGARPGYLWSPAGTMKRPRCAGRWRRRWRKRGAWIGCGRYAGGDQAKPLRGPASGEGGHHPPVMAAELTRLLRARGAQVVLGDSRGSPLPPWCLTGYTGLRA